MAKPKRFTFHSVTRGLFSADSRAAWLTTVLGASGTVWKAAEALSTLQFILSGVFQVNGPEVVRVLTSWVWIVLLLVGIVWLVRRVFLSSQQEALDEEMRQLFILSAGPASREVEAVLSHICERLRPQGQCQQHLASLVERGVIAPNEQARGVLRAALRMRDAPKVELPPKSDTQVLFGLCYRAYQRAVMDMRDAGQAGGYAFADDGNYREWKRHDQDFLNALNQLISKSDFAVLRSLVDRHMWNDGVREYWT